MVKKVKKYFINNFSYKKLNKKKKNKFFFYKTFKFFWISSHNFFKQQITLKSSVLTYFSLMAIVPFFALIFVIAKNMGYQEIIEKELLLRFEEQKEIIIKVFEFAKNLLVEAKGGVIALIGVLFLFWSLIKLFSHLENSLNKIWHVKNVKNYKKRFSNYFVLMFVLPFFFVAFFPLKTYILNFFFDLDLFFNIVNVIMKAFFYVVILGLFIFIYMFIPNTKVKFKYAFFSAFFSSLAYHLIQAVYFTFQIGITKLNAIYGSFAALPLFLIWLRISWIVFLFGAEMNYTFQNLDKIHIRDSEKTNDNF